MIIIIIIYTFLNYIDLDIRISIISKSFFIICYSYTP